jgi:FkbM family methyltransferase
MKQYTISYAQNREDVLLDAFFPGVEQGFYVDVGANHPEIDSVTKLFYLKGWRGINVEPTKRLIKLLEAERPKDTNLNVGISNREGELSFREYEDFGIGLSTFSEDIKKMNVKDKVAHSEKFKDYKVPVTTLAKMFEEQKVGTIHFLKVDIEGYEYEALEGNDWKKYRPQVICIEANHVNKDWRPLLQKHKYSLVFHDGLNEYYVADEHPEILKRFSYVQGIIGRPIMPLQMSRDIAREVALNKKLEIDRQNLQSRNNELEKYIYALHQQIESQNRIKKQMSSLARNIDAALIRRIKKIDKGVDRAVRHRSIAPELPKGSASTSDLLELAKENDRANFYTTHRRRLPSVRHLLFLMVMGLYNCFRKLGIFVARTILKVLRKLKGALS